jgi:hypothetical protein
MSRHRFARILSLVVLVVASGCHTSAAPPSASTAPNASSTQTLAPAPVTSPPAMPAAASATPSAAGPAPVAPGRTALAFDADTVDSAPTGFSFGRTGSGALGRWRVQADKTAPSPPHVLAQLDADSTDYRFPVAVANEPKLHNVRVTVLCKMVSGSVDRACGLVLRYQNEDNYYLTRANALENNIRFYKVEKGKRRELASYSGAVAPNVWHEYRIEARGDRFAVDWDRQRVLEHTDTTFAEGGQIGVWTKADSVTYFDDLQIEAL